MLKLEVIMGLRRRKKLLIKIILSSLVIAVGFFGIKQMINQSASADSINNTDFVITIDTSKGNGAQSFTIPIRASSGITPNYTVDCNNDGVVEATGQTGNYTCNYPTAGVYKIRIGGVAPSIFFNNTGDKLKLTEINQWGNQQWRQLNSAFYGAENLELKATDVPDLSRVTTLDMMFHSAKSLTGAHGNWRWNTSQITNMSSMFFGAKLFNGDITHWDVSKVTSFSNMFRTNTMFNQNISTWNTESAVRFDFMFTGATNFNQPIGNWNTTKVTHFNAMFTSTKFNQNIGGWDMRSAISLNSMFNGNSVFNNGGSDSIKNWNTSEVTDMTVMFAATPFNQPIGNWNTAKVTNMSGMFYGNRIFNQPLNNWNVARVKNFSSMFYNAFEFNQPLNNWQTSNAENMANMFFGTYRFNQNISNWDMSRVTNVTNMLGSESYLPMMHPDNYDAILTGWAGQNLKPNLTLGAKRFLYCSSTSARDILTKPVAQGGKGWTIVGDVLGCPPKNIQLSNSLVNENSTAVGDFSAETMTSGTKTFALVSGDGAEDNAKFSLSSDGKLSFMTAPDFENPTDAGDIAGNNTYSIRIKVTDSANTRLYQEKNFVITVRDVDDTKPTIDFVAPVKFSNSTITGVQVIIRDNVAINASGVSIDQSGTAQASDLNCNQITVREVRCTVSATHSGNLAIKAVDVAGNALIGAESNFVIDRTAPTINNFDINTDAPNSINQPKATFSVSDNLAVGRIELEYIADNHSPGVSSAKTILTNPSNPVVLQLDPDEVQHQVTLRAYDTAGNVTSLTIIFPPIVSITSPTILSNQAINDSTVTITSPMGNDIDQIQITGVAGATLSDCVGAGDDRTEPYASPVRCKINNINQTGTVRITARDVGTTARGSSERAYRIDTTAPTLAITSPTKLSNVDIVDTVITVSDDVGIDANAVMVDPTSTAGTSDWNCTQVNPLSVTCTVKINASGNLVIKATDRAGNRVSGYENNYIVDRVAPNVTITAPTVVTQVNQHQYIIKGTCTAGDNNVVVTVAGQNQVVGCDAGNWQGEFDLSTVSDGLLVITAKQTDQAGNSTMVNSTVLKDTIAPLVTINQPSLINSVNMASYILEGTCELTEGEVELEWNSQTVKTSCDATGKWQKSFDFTSVPDGNDVLEVKASQADRYGNKTTVSAMLNKQAVRPTVVVKRQAGQVTPTKINEAKFVIEFSVDVSALVANQVTVRGTTGNITNFAMINARTYELTLTGMTDGDTAEVSLSANQVRDVHGNFNLASTGTDNAVKYDITSPIVTITTSPITYQNLTNYQLNGLCTIGDGDVTVKIGSLQTSTACGTDGKWQKVLDVSALADGNLTAEASQTDSAGNIGQVNASVTKDSRVYSQYLQGATTESDVATALTRGVLSVNQSGTCSNIQTSRSKLLSPNNITSPRHIKLLGGLHFELSCTTNGGDSEITLQLGEYYPDVSLLRAYKLVSGQLQPANVQFTNTAGKTYAIFKLTDGVTANSDNLIDNDGAVNARIVDPLYFGIYQSPTHWSMINAPNSGLRPFNNWWLKIILLSLAVIAGLIGIRKVKQNLIH